MQRLIFVGILLAIVLAIDLYVFQAVRTAFQDLSYSVRRIIYLVYWGLVVLVLLGFFYYHFTPEALYSKTARVYIMSAIFVNYFSKFFVVIFLLIDDIIRGGRWIYAKLSALFLESPVAEQSAQNVSRLEFLSQAGLVVAAVPLAAMSYGIISGAHDYQVKRRIIFLEDLPLALDGIKIGQISDIHAGSFVNRKAVKGGVDLLMREKPDIIFFTGDMVNDRAEEMDHYMNVFEKVKAPLGVFSVLGNHDYGEYVRWSSEQHKLNNFEQLKKVHSLLGWQLLLNENRKLIISGEPLAIVGVENWGKARWSQKYGNLDKAVKGAEEIPVKLLLSHDPSHWKGQILEHPVKFDVTFSGHTHGFQFGIEVGSIKWSPSQYFYKEWAGLYKEHGQNLYVNRGYGYLGFPGRIGMPPEITIIKLKRA